MRRFDGQKGWHYVPFDETTGGSLRPLVEDAWPALLKVKARIAKHSWTATVMPIKDGPLFIALTASARRKLRLAVGDVITVFIKPL